MAILVGCGPLQQSVESCHLWKPGKPWGTIVVVMNGLMLDGDLT